MRCSQFAGDWSRRGLRWTRVLVLVAVLMGAVGGSLRGQDTPGATGDGPAAAPTAPSAPSGVEITTDTSGMYTEWGVVLAGVAAATFVVCRSSRRN